MVINELFKKQKKEKPDFVAVSFYDRDITYSQYDRESDLFAMGLINRGIQKGDRVGIYVPNWPEFLFTYMGAAKIGAIAVPISWRFTSHEIKFVIEDSGISLLVMADEFTGINLKDNLKSIRDELTTLKDVVMVSADIEDPSMIPYSEFLKEPDIALDEAKSLVSPEDTLLFIYTSGTTGVPKAAMLTHKNVITYTDSETKATNFTGDDSILLDIPLNHVGASVMGVISCLNKGATLVMVDRFDPEETLRIIQDKKITVMGQVPAQYSMQLLNPNIDKYDLSSIKTAIVSSQPCSSKLLVEMKKKLGIFPQNAYGLTEATGTFTFTRPEDTEEKLKHTVGLPIEGAELAIMDSENNILPNGEVGEIVVRGELVMKGYWNRPEENAIVFDDRGYLHTGDMGKIDDSGYLVISGRKKEMYIRGGENVYPPEVEEAISKHPDVFMVAVVGRPDPIMGEVGRAYIALNPDSNTSEEDFKEFLKQRLANYKIPKDFIIRPYLPLTPLGKVKKLDLYKEVEQEFKDV